MSSAFRHLNPTRLLRDSCSAEVFTGTTKDASHVPTDTYAAPVTFHCNAISKNRFDYSGSPPILTSELDIYFDADCTVTRQSRVTHGGQKYRVMDVQDLAGAGKIAFCKRWEQVTG